MIEHLRAAARAPFFFVLLLSATVVAMAASRTRVPTLNDFDQPFYIGMAYDLAVSGRFTDGFVHAVPTADGQRPSGKMFAPLYPLLLATFAKLDPAVMAGFECIVRSEGKSADCGDPMRGLRLLQRAFLVAFFAMVWLIAREIGAAAMPATHLGLIDDSRAQLFPWLALAASFFPAQRLVNTFMFAMTESLTLFWCTAAALCGVVAWRRNRPWVAAAAGALLGAAALTRPGYLYLFAVIAAVISVVGARHTDRRRMLTMCGAFVAGGALVVLPWLVRNALLMNLPSIDYRAHTLAQRVSYNSMSLGEWVRSFVCFMAGTGATELLMGKGACQVFSWAAPEGFYLRAQTEVVPDIIAASGGWDKAFSYLMREKVLAQPLWHGAVTLTMALAGAWIANWCGVVFGLAAMWLTWRAAVERKPAFLIVALPGWFMLLFQGAVAVNQDRYNLYLVLPYALAGGWLMLSAYERYRLAPTPSHS